MGPNAVRHSNVSLVSEIMLYECYKDGKKNFFFNSSTKNFSVANYFTANRAYLCFVTMITYFSYTGCLLTIIFFFNPIIHKTILIMHNFSSDLGRLALWRCFVLLPLKPKGIQLFLSISAILLNRAYKQLEQIAGCNSVE